MTRRSLACLIYWKRKTCLEVVQVFRLLKKTPNSCLNARYIIAMAHGCVCEPIAKCNVTSIDFHSFTVIYIFCVLYIHNCYHKFF